MKTIINSGYTFPAPEEVEALSKEWFKNPKYRKEVLDDLLKLEMYRRASQYLFEKLKQEEALAKQQAQPSVPVPAQKDLCVCKKVKKFFKKML